MHTHATRGTPRRRCKTCHTQTPAGALVHGQCALCAGLQTLPLRGERGRFLTFAPPVLADPEPQMCCGVPARITDEDGTITGHCGECGALLFRQLPDTDDSNGTGGAR
jgi:hypothetical protein